MKDKLIIVLSCLVAVLALVTGISVGSDGKMKLDGGEIKSELVDIGEMATVEYNYTHVATLSKQKSIKIADVFKIDLPGSWAKSSLVYSVDGCIKFGYDFSQIDVNLDNANKVVTVTLPEVKVISNELDQSTVKILDQKNGIFKLVGAQDIFDSEQQIKDEELKLAQEKGAEDSAQTNAATIIQNTLTTTMDLDGYDIVVQ